MPAIAVNEINTKRSTFNLTFTTALSWLLLCLLVVTPTTSASTVIKMLRQDSQPKYSRTPHATPGLCDRLYLALSDSLRQQGIEAQIEEGFTPIRRIFSHIEHDTDYIFCGAARSEERELKFGYFDQPLYTVSNVVAIQPDDPLEPASMEDLATSGVVVGALSSVASTRFLKSHPGIAVHDVFKTPLEGLKITARGHRRMMFFYHDLGIYHLIREHSLPLKVWPTRFRTYQHWLVHSKRMDPVLTEHLRKLLQELSNNGELKRIAEPFVLPQP